MTCRKVRSCLNRILASASTDHLLEAEPRNFC
jgi:hypothetical protein